MPSSSDIGPNVTWTLKIMGYDALNNLHNRLRAKLGYDSDKRIDYDQQDPNDQALYSAVDAELCTRRQADPGKVAAMLAEELIASAGGPPYNEESAPGETGVDEGDEIE